MHIFHRFGDILRLARRAYSPYKWQIVWLGLLSLIGGFFEGVGINAVVPLLTFMLNSSDGTPDAISDTIRSVFIYLHIDFAPKFLLIFIVALFLARTIALLLVTYIQLRINVDYEASSRTRVLNGILGSSWPHLLRQKSGQLETVLMVDVPASSSLLGKITDITKFATSLAMYLIVAFNVSWQITAITLLLGVLLVNAMRPITWRIRALSAERAKGFADMSHFANENISGIKTVKALGVEQAAFEQGTGIFARMRSFTLKVSLLYQTTVQIIPPLGIVYIALIFGVVYRTHFIELAALPTILYLIYRIVTYVQQLQQTVQDISMLAPHLQRVIGYEEASAGQQEHAVSGAQAFSFAKDIRFENLVFEYLPGESVLHGVSFSIPKGSTLGIIGPSGSGKTTCVDLLLRLLRPTSGAITVDGIDAKDISLSEWRKNIGYVSQDFFLLHGTIRDNIRFYDASLTDTDIWAAAEQANIATFIRESTHGLDTMVGDRGITLSAGQRQRVVIARALARKPQLLILDEATSALDNESEAHLQEVIRSIKGKVTIVIIAHRLSTIMDADMLVALEKGKVIETGTPQALLADKSSYFFKVTTVVG